MLRTRSDAMIFALVVDDRRRRARGNAARVHPAPVRPVPRRRRGRASSSTASFFGLGHFEQGYDAMIATGAARRGLGRALPRAPQHRRADGQPRRVQPCAAREVSWRCGEIARYVIDRICALLALVAARAGRALPVFVVSLPAVTPRIYASDEIQYFSYLRSLWFDHDVSFENEYRYFYDHNIARRRLSRDVPRARDRGRAAAQLRDDRLRAPVGAVLRGRRPVARGCARGGRDVASTATRSRMSRRSPTGRRSTGSGASLLVDRARRRGASARIARPEQLATVARRSPSGSARRCSSTCTSRRRSRTPARRSRSRCSSRLAARARDVDASAARSRSALSRRADGDGARAGRVLRARPGARFGSDARGVTPTRTSGSRGDPAASRRRGSRAAFVVGYLPQLLAYHALNGHSGPVVARHAEDELAGAARAARCWSRRSTDSSSGRRSPRSRSLGLVAAGACAAGRTRSAHRRWCAAADGRAAGLRQRQRRVVDRRRRVRPAAVRRADDPAGRSASRRCCASAPARRRPGRRRVAVVDRALRLVEPRADGASSAPG